MDDRDLGAREARVEARRRLAEEGRASMRCGKIEEMDRSFDIDFWQAQTTSDR